jgi:Transmembrane secretion effector
LIWGYLAAMTGLSLANFAAAAGMVVALPLTWRWKLRTELGVDLAPSMHWPAPITDHKVEEDQGPVLVTVEYRIDPRHRKQFLVALDRFAEERRRDGAYAWGVFEDAAEQGRIVETFLVGSWIEHLRQHERVTNADRLVQDSVDRFHVHGTPKVDHFIAVDPDHIRDEEGPG